MEIETLLPNLSKNKQEAADIIIKHIGADMFIKSALYRAMQSCQDNLVIENLDKWTKKIGSKKIKEIRNLWLKHG